MTTTNLDHLTDDQWRVAIADQIDARPDAGLEDVYFMGRMDRDLGLDSRSCEYEDDNMRMAYVAGYCTTQDFSFEDGELEDYREWREDMDFFRGGC